MQEQSDYDSLEGPVQEGSIFRRNGGCAAQVDGKVYVWGGEGSEKRQFPSTNEDEDGEEDDEDESDDEELLDVWTVTVLPPPRLKDKGAPFDVYDLHTCTWSRQKTEGDAPILGLGSTLNYHPETHTLYLFGGYNEGNFDAEIYRVEVDEWIWEKIYIQEQDLKPSGRYLTGVLIHGYRLCVLGGVGPDIKRSGGRPQDDGASYTVAYTQGEGFGWNNEYYEFDMKYGKWSAPLANNAVRPDPLGGHCFVKFDTHRALLFGGRYETGRRNDTWIFDLEKRTFAGPINAMEPLPTGRSFATITPLIDPILVGQKLGGCGPPLQQRMLLLWGKQLNDIILPETWILSITADEQYSWRQLSIALFPRSWHTASALYYHNSTECRIAVFGGNVHSGGSTGKRRNTADMRVLTFGVASLSRLCADVIASHVRDVSSLNLPPHSLTYRCINRAIQTFLNSKPIATKLH